MKISIKNIAMLMMATLVGFSMVACDDDDDDNVYFKNEYGSIVDNGNSVTMTYSYSSEEEGVKISENIQLIAYFENDELVKVIEKTTITPASLASVFYEFACEDWEDDYVSKPVLNGNVITAELKVGDDFKGMKKADVLEYLKSDLEDDEEDEKK